MIGRTSSPIANLKTHSTTKLCTTEEGICRWLSDQLEIILRKAIPQLNGTEYIEEIRLRINQPLTIRTEKNEYFLTSSGQSGSKMNSYIVTKEDLIKSLERMTYSSIYAAEEELRQGFITLPGGHRVGISGETIVEHTKIRTIRNISALNIRLARQPEIASDIIKLLLDKNRTFYHTLLVSPPRAGKTTILRFLVKQLSDGIPSIGLEGQTVSVVDERSEIAGMWQGVPSFDLGCRTDVLDRCPKALGLNMMIRSMSPAVIAVDELGGPDDVSALKEALRCGVRILATAHASSLHELQGREYLQDLFRKQMFERVVILSRAKGPGTIESVYDMQTGHNLLKASLKNYLA